MVGIYIGTPETLTEVYSGADSTTLIQDKPNLIRLLGVSLRVGTVLFPTTSDSLVIDVFALSI